MATKRAAEPRASALNAGELRVRMYRVGFGDCFLLSLPGQKRHHHILIDCGVHFRGDIRTMERVVADLRQECADRIDLVVASHAHQDHISGFGTYAKEFSQVDVGEVWMPWTEDPADAQAARLRSRQLSLLTALSAHLRAMRKYSGATEAIIENYISFGLARNTTSLGVLRSGFRGTPTVRYLTAGANFKNAARIPGLGIRVLSPSRDEEALAKMDPPTGQRWITKKRAQDPDQVIPFPGAGLKRDHMRKVAPECMLAAREETDLHQAIAPDDAVAALLDDVMNNTSLVLLLRYRGMSLLFPGDAQWGNWSTWLEKHGADSLLADVSFLKVGHHGSHNSTPRTIVPKLTHPELSAMISTHCAPFKSIPKKELMDDLTKQSRRRAIRSDWASITGVQGDIGPEKLPRGFKRGPFWIDYVRDLGEHDG